MRRGREIEFGFAQTQRGLGRAPATVRQATRHPGFLKSAAQARLLWYNSEGTFPTSLEVQIDDA
jgi:hypothetical protein